MAQVVVQEGARALGRVTGEEQPAEERHVGAGSHAAVQLHRAAEHQQLERLQQAELALAALEGLLAQPPALGSRCAFIGRTPLGGRGTNDEIKQ